MLLIPHEVREDRQSVAFISLQDFETGGEDRNGTVILSKASIVIVNGDDEHLLSKPM